MPRPAHDRKSLSTGPGQIGRVIHRLEMALPAGSAGRALWKCARERGARPLEEDEMSNATYIKMTGWVARDPELRSTNGDQTPVCTIRMGTANRWPDRSTGEWREGPASYFDVACWRSLAVNVCASLRKGHMITIHGTFRNKAWTDKDGNARTSLEITASSVGHELVYGWAHFNRTQRASFQAEQDLADGEVNRVIDPGAIGSGGFGSGAAGSGQDRDFGAVGSGFEVGPVAGQPEQNPFDGGYRSEPSAERVFGTGDDDGADDAGASETAADAARREEVAVPV